MLCLADLIIHADRYPKVTELGSPWYGLDRAGMGDRRRAGITHHIASG